MKIALALSGGGIRCAAHLGVIKALLEEGFEISAISASSGGAIAGLFYAAGFTPDEAIALLGKIKYKKVLPFNWFRKSLFHLNDAIRFINDLIPYKRLEDLPIKFYVATVDLESAETVYFDKGNLAKLLMASSALVPIFHPVSYNHRHYVDGGFMNNLPVEPLVGCKEKILGINVNPVHSRYKNSFSWTLKRVLLLMMFSNIKSRIPLCDYYFEIEETGRFGILDTKGLEKCFEIGYEYAKKNIKKIKEI